MTQCHGAYYESNASALELRATMAPSGGTQCHDSYAPAGSGPGPAQEMTGGRFLVETEGGTSIVRAVGRVNWTKAGQLTELVSNITAPDLILDFTAAINDSAGTGALIGCAERGLRRGQRVVLVVTAVLYEVLLGLGMDNDVPVLRSMSDAHAWLSRQPGSVEVSG